MEKFSTVLDRLCGYYDSDGDEKGWDIQEFGGPEISCRCCRADYDFGAKALAAHREKEAQHIAATTRLVKAPGATLRIRPGQRTYAHSYWAVELVDGIWPAEADIVKLCDDAPFGGNAKINGAIADVMCFLD